MKRKEFDTGINTKRLIRGAGATSSNHSTKEIVSRLFVASARNILEYPFSDWEQKDWAVDEVLETISKEEAAKPSVGFALSHNLIDYFKQKLLDTFDVNAFVEKLMNDSNVLEYIEQAELFECKLKEYYEIQEELDNVKQATMSLKAVNVSIPFELVERQSLLEEKYKSARSQLEALRHSFETWQEDYICQDNYICEDLY